MTYRLTIIEKPGYLHATATGEHTAANARRFLTEAHEACMKRGHDAVLLEVNFSGPSLPAHSIFDVISSQSAAAQRLRRIAYVETGQERDPEQMKFAETVARNRGVNVRLFRDLAGAEAWLLAREDGAGRSR